MCRLFGKQRCIDIMDRLAKSYDYTKSEYVGVIAWGEGKGNDCLNRDFEKMTTIEFEDQSFSCYVLLERIPGQYV